MKPRGDLRHALFPGDRRVWLIAAAVGAVLLAGIAIAVLTPRDYYTGTNSVRLRSLPMELGLSVQRPDMCVPGQRIPKGTGRVEIQVETLMPRPPIDFEIVTDRGRIPGRTITPPSTGRSKVQFAIPELERDLTGASICFRVHGDRVFVGGTDGLAEFDIPVRAGGQSHNVRIALWYRPPAGERRSVASLLPDTFRRAAVFRPGTVGPWTYALLLALVFPGLIYAGLRLLATAAENRPRRIPVALAIGLIAFAHGATWALVTPPFNAPDETEHFAYVQKLGETGKGLRGAGEVYSTSQARAVGASRVLTSSEVGDGRPVWLESQEREWRELEERSPAKKDNGGGAAPSISAHSPLYYSLLTPTYLASKEASPFTALTLMRITSALLGAIVAACAFLLVLELLPGRRTVAVTAGLMVAFQPMFGFMSGAVNNDMGVNAASAVVLWLTVRAMMRGLTPRLGVALGAALVIAPLMKATAFALYPAVALALGYVLWRQRSTKTLAAIGAVAGTALVFFGVWTAVSGYFEQSTFTTPGGEAPGSGFAGTENPRGLLAYLWQIFLPPLGFMVDYWHYPGGWPFFDVYVVRGWGSFGWYAMTFSDWVYWVIVVVMGAVALMAALALWRHRRSLDEIWAPALVLLVAIVALIGGVHAYYFPNGPRSPPFPEQGRYAFPLIAAFGAVAAGAAFAFGRRWVVPIATTLTVAVMGLAYASQFLALTRFYT